MLRSVTRHTTSQTNAYYLTFIFNYFPKKLISFLFHISPLQFLQTISNMADSTCSICCDPFNASNRKPILCPFGSCAKHACRTCYEIFLCGDDVSVPKCMFCNTTFTHSHIQQLGLTKTFLAGPFARHQEDILFAQELAMLPAAQTAVAHERLLHNIHLQLRDVYTKIKQLNDIKHYLLATKNHLLRPMPFFYIHIIHHRDQHNDHTNTQAEAAAAATIQTVCV